MAGRLVAARAGIPVRVRDGVLNDRAAGRIFADARRAGQRGSGTAPRRGDAHAAAGGFVTVAGAVGGGAAEGRGLELQDSAAGFSDFGGAAANRELRPERECAPGGTGCAAFFGIKPDGAAGPGAIAAAADVAHDANCSD